MPAPSGFRSHFASHSGIAPATDGWTLLGTVVNRPRNSEVFAEGDPATRVYRVFRGAVRITKLLSDGRRQVLGFYLPGEVFALQAGETYRFSAEAVVDTTVHAVLRKTLRTQAAQDPVLAQRLWELAAVEHERIQDQLLLLGRRTATERVAAFLLDMAARSDEGDAFDLPMSRQDIADFLGLTIETVSRTLTQLQRDNVIALPGYRQVMLKDRRRLLDAEG